MSKQADEISARIQDLLVDGSFVVNDIAEACGEILGHCIRQMSAGTKEHQPRVLERNLRAAKDHIALHARKKCPCAPERPNCTTPNCGHPVFRHKGHGPPDYGRCTIPDCECWTG